MDIVIGAAFGDEGKGVMTHYLASRYGNDAIVVRFNGGAQAGHTVVTSNQQRHVFRHIGSGTFAGAATFLSQFFVSNPILFLEEINQLHLLGLAPKVYIDPSSIITTPYDMMINQIIEEQRGHQRHGSCGVGFAETIERNLLPEYSLTVADLDDRAKTMNTLYLIQKKWLAKRLATLGITDIPEQWREHIESDDIFQLFVEHLALFSAQINVTRIDLNSPSHQVIFEGAQGLMLDQDRGWFPHVTRSNTGLKNVLHLVSANDNMALNVFYVTRCYLTRHGAGPLPHELTHLPYKQVIDHTNVTNDHQGHLRYAWFNLSLVKSFIQSDLNDVSATVPVDSYLAVTCLDQVDNQITFIDDNKVCQASQDAFLKKLREEINISKMFGNYGPTSETIRELGKA